MPKVSAGLLQFRRRDGGLEVFLVHPGGPFWKNKDTGAWSIPKGEFADDEEPLAAAIREFEEETGFTSAGPYHPLAPVRQPGGKVVHAWSFEGDCEARQARSNTLEREWPPGSGRVLRFPEVDRAEWFPLDEALRRINPGQAPLLRELQEWARRDA
jgi:predicted NUDIX family NTP pyrophosphohydrolase